MRGEIDPQAAMFSYISLEQRVPADHPIRKIRQVVDKALKALHDDFSDLYSTCGRSPIPPEILLRAQFLQIFYSSARKDNWLSASIIICFSAGLSDWGLMIRYGIIRHFPRTAIAF